MADDLDILTIEEAKQAISMSAFNDDHTAVLERQVTAVSRLIDSLCGPVVQREVEAEIHHGGESLIQLRYRPVKEITLVREARGGTPVTINAIAFGGTGDGYYADPADFYPGLLAGTLHRRAAGWGSAWWGGPSTVEVTYIAGRFEDTESVDPRFKEAASAVLRRLWKREAGVWSQSSSFFEDNDSQFGTGFFRVAKPIVVELLNDERIPAVPA